MTHRVADELVSRLVEAGIKRIYGIVGHSLNPVTLAIVLLVPRTGHPRQIAFHRFAEVSIGIGVALILAWMWPEREGTPSRKM